MAFYGKNNKFRGELPKERSGLNKFLSKMREGYIKSKKSEKQNIYDEQAKKAQREQYAYEARQQLGIATPEEKAKLDKRKYLVNQAKYGRTASGRFGAGIKKGFNAIRPGGFARMSYGSQLPPSSIGMQRKTLKGVNRGNRGRPFGTKDPRYAAYGGVYEFRKAMAHKRALERANALRAAAVTPMQRAILQQIEARQQMQRQNPEASAIPDTFGNVNIDGISDEIDRATNLVD